MARDRMRVLIDGTPLLGQRTGVGRYTAALAEELASMRGVDIRAVALTLRGWRALRSVLPHEVWARGLPCSARVLRQCWLHSSFPPIELIAGFSDVVHGTNFVLPVSARAAGVLTIHDLAFLDAPDELPPLDRELPALVRRSAERARVVCTPTKAVAAAVVERLDVPSERVMVTPLGVDPAWFTARPPSEERRRRLGLPEHYLLFVGAEGPRKGLDALYTAHAMARDLPPLVLTGPSPSGVDGQVIRTGYLPEVELRSVVAGAAAVVLPSRDEGFGLPVLEALACNVPVVCSDVPALREVAGDQASFVPYGDVDGLAATMRSVLSEGSPPHVAAARRAHAAGFTWRRCAEATVAAYRRAAHR
jgi:glycosyltransferase involved in cell wall biosynthesis